MDGTSGGVYIRPVGAVEITPTGNVTINPTGTVSVKGYIPNVGNTTADSFTLSRAYIGLTTTDGDADITSQGDISLYAGNAISLSADYDIDIRTDTDCNIRAIGDINISCNDIVYLTSQDEMQLKSYGEFSIARFDGSQQMCYITIDSDGWFVADSVAGYFNFKRGTTSCLMINCGTDPNEYEYKLFEQNGIAQLKCDETLQNCPTLFHKYNQGYLSAQLLNQDVAQSNVAADITIDESELFSEMKWNCCTFAFTNNAKVNLNGGRMTFENCVFSGTGKVIIDTQNNNLFVTFINCVFETDVEAGEHGVNKVIFKNCRFGHLFAKGRYTADGNYGLNIIDGCFINTLELETDFNTAGNCVNYMITNNRIVTKQITGLGDITTQYYFNNHEGAV